MSRKTLSASDFTNSLAKNSSVNKITFKKREFSFTSKQQDIITALLDDKNKVVIIDGPAGSSKSYTAIYAALRAYQEQDFDEILYLRTAVESASHSMGYLKGDLDDKFSVYRAVLDEKIGELVTEGSKSGLPLNAAPINYIRGASWRNKFVILDESQNITIDEAKTLMTRIGEGTRLVICGDSQQKDIKNSGSSLIKEIFDNPESEEAGIKFFQLTSKDIVRSEIVKFIVEKFENHYKEKSKKPIFHQQKISEEWSPSK